ncbi:MAG TPA: hypothetical protein VMW42_03300 [Desulfatiglandales bacterium]|nr:hypothetical protein [Desulfatiglandales bacterium]
MDDKNIKETEEKAEEKNKKKKVKKPLPFCTTAPSAEHARAEDEDEPCDDDRAGE